MLTLISPAKSLDFKTPAVTDLHSQPAFPEQSQILIDQLKQLAPQELASLMKLSDKLATLNFDYIQSFQQPFTPQNAKAAVLTFHGEVYQGLEADKFTPDNFDFAQRHLRILSGLFGLLKPLDLIQPYRLEMGTKLTTAKGNNLYQFWGMQINQQIQRELKNQSNPQLINLASNEYFKAIKAGQLSCQIITPSFKDFKNGQYKVISFYAKRARGLMARYIIENEIDSAEQLKDFNLAGYTFHQQSSNEDNFVFLRDPG